MQLKKELESRAGIELLVNKFYEQVIVSDTIGHFFNEVVKLDWDVHIPVMYSFWESVLLGAGTYQGNPMIKHIALNQQSALLPKHFEEWLHLWTTTIDTHFTGSKAEEAKSRAQSIAQIMLYRVHQH